MRDRKDLVKIVNFCRKYGVKSIKSQDFEMELFPKPANQVGELGARQKKITPIAIKDLAGASAADSKMPDDSELLFFATDHFEDLQADKEDLK